MKFNLFNLIVVLLVGVIFVTGCDKKQKPIKKSDKTTKSVAEEKLATKTPVINFKPEDVEKVVMTKNYIAYKKRAKDVEAKPLEEYKINLAPPYTDAIVTDAPYCKEEGDVFMQGVIVPLVENPSITNRFSAMQVERSDTNLQYQCVFETIDGRLWYLFPDKFSQDISNGKSTFKKINIYGKIDETTGLVKIKSYVSGGRHFKWNEEEGKMFAPEFKAEVIKTQAQKDKEQKEMEEQREQEQMQMEMDMKEK